MEWRDQGVLLSTRRHAETSVIIDVFTADHGLHAGVVRGGTSRRIAPLLQPGAQLDVRWRARLEDHLGAYTVEPIRSRAAQVMDDRLALSGLNAAVALLMFTLPEREAQPDLYRQTQVLLDMIGTEALWPFAYLKWEVGLLEEMGFALDLTTCAVTGSKDDLAFVSPRTGRAVSRGAAGKWVDQLLPLPACLLGQGAAPTLEVLEGLDLTGHFLETHLAAGQGDKALPDARQRLLDRLKRLADQKA